PYYPYQPGTFSLLFIWWAILAGLGLIPVIGFPALIAGIVLLAVFLYKCWNQIQDGYQRVSAGRAVGFLFIPFFNFYWVFVAVLVLAEDLNMGVRRYGLNAPIVSEGLAVTSCILGVLMFPGVFVWPLAILVHIAWFVVTLLFLNQVKHASMVI